MIIWAGTSNKDVGMVIEHYPGIILPTRKQEIQKVPGRNGDVIIDEGAFENYEQQYSAFLDAKYIGGLEVVMPKVVSWLLGNSGYKRLEDSYFPDVYRMAYYSGGAQFVSIFNEYGEGTLTFNCAPEKYYKFGERVQEITNGQVLYNPSSFPSYPLIRIGYTGTVTLKLNGSDVMTISPSPFTGAGANEELVLDVKDNRAYSVWKSTTVQRPDNWYSNRGGQVVGKFENLRLGKETKIQWTVTGGTVRFVSIRPNWWTI